MDKYLSEELLKQRQFMWDLGWNAECKTTDPKLYNPYNTEPRDFFKSGKLGDLDVIFYAMLSYKDKFLVIGYIKKYMEKDPNSFVYEWDKFYKEKYNYDYTFPDIQYPGEFLPIFDLYKIPFDSYEDLKEILDLENLRSGKFLEYKLKD